MEKKIAQISDIHFGEKNFSLQLKDNLLNQLEDENPDLIIVSGDLTTEGYVHEYEQAAEFVDQLGPLPVLIQCQATTMLEMLV